MRWVQGLAWFALVAMSAGMVLLPSLETVVAFTVIDDAMAYTRIAQNVVSRGVLTFDGVTITNGFHPLWQAALIPVYEILQDPWRSLRGAFALVAVLLGAALFLFTRVSRSWGLSPGGYLMAFFLVFANVRSFTVLYSLLESPLVLLCYTAFLYCVCVSKASRFQSSKMALLAGLLMGLCFLARTDSFLLPVSFGLVLLARLFRGEIEKGRSFRIAAWSGLGTLVVVAPYLLANHLVFGRLSPVSAAAKLNIRGDWEWAYAPLQGFYQQYVPRIAYILGLPLAWSPILMTALILAGSGVLVAVFTGERRVRVHAILLRCPEFFLFAFLHFFFVYFLAPGEALFSTWYYISEILAVALILGAAVPPNRRLLDYSIAVTVTSILILQAFMYPDFVERKTMTWAKFEVAEFIRDHLPADTRLAIMEPGIVSYFSQRDFVSLKGHLGDFELSELCRQRDFTTIVEKYEVEYLVADVSESREIKIPAEEVYSTEIRTLFRDFRRDPRPLVLYRVRPTRQ